MPLPVSMASQPGCHAMDIADVVDEVRRHGGVMRRSRLPRYRLEQAVREGRLVVPRRGLVAVHDLPEPVLAAVSLNGVLSCASAADAHGLELLHPPGAIHVTVPRGTRWIHRPGVVVHQRAVTIDEGVTTVPRTAADCARCLPTMDALVVIDSALRSGASMDTIDACLWGRGSGPARALLRRADRRSESSGETVGRVVLQDAGLDVEPQVFIQEVGRVDLLVEGRVVVEIDGFAYHCGLEEFTRDRRRDATLQSLGFRVLRFTWADVVRRPDYVVATVRRVLAQIP